MAEALIRLAAEVVQSDDSHRLSKDGRAAGIQRTQSVLVRHRVVKWKKNDLERHIF